MPPSRDDFYVGYLALPASDRRVLRFLVPATLWLLVIVAALVATAQRSPGDAVWDDGKPISREGTLRTKPYPMLVDDTGRTVILVEQGKHGAQERAARFDGQRVHVDGWRLARDGREIMELVPGASAFETLSRAAPATDAASMLGARSVRLRGEIVDSKCYLGAMKPGDGKTHKACAALCISNGIPPMLITRNERGDLEYVLLEDADGASVSDRVAPFAGEPIEVEGALHSIGSLKVLRLSRDSPRLVQWR